MQKVEMKPWNGNGFVCSHWLLLFIKLSSANGIMHIKYCYMLKSGRDTSMEMPETVA
jgi:hypothetical protein